MPLSRARKAGMEAAGFSSAPKLRKASFWITADVRMIPHVDMGKKINSPCHLPVIRRAGILKYHTTKEKLSGHWKNTVSGAAKELNGW